MLFNSFEFALFALPVLAIYSVLSHRLQNLFLLGASYVFYGSWDWRFLSLIWLSTLVDFYCGLKLGGVHTKNRKGYLMLSLAVNLGLLGVFKYFNFFADSFSALLEALGLSVAPPVLAIALPVGISFYTFQTLSYTIDIYQGKTKPTRNLGDFALFVAFFPQLVAGPIEKSHRFLPQIIRPRQMTLEGFYEGCHLIFWGLFKKVFVADNCAKIVDNVFRGAGPPSSGLEYLVGSYAFAWQIYCDFSGYTDVARGTARIMGFDLMLNFNMPYFARNLSDFWRRWHISLSTWFKEYVYLPLGGNRVTKGRLAFNLMVVFLVSGLWHGADGKFVAWGAAHGVGMVALSLGGESISRLSTSVPKRLWSVLAVVITFHYVALTFALWQTESVPAWFRMLADIASNPIPVGGELTLFTKFLGFMALPLVVESLQKRAEAPLIILNWPPAVRGTLYVVCLFLILRLGVFDGAEFIYFQF